MTSRISESPALAQQLAVGHRGVHVGEVAADLVLGRPVAGQRHGQPGNGAVAAVDHGEVLGEGQAQQAGQAPGRRQALQAAREFVAQAEAAGRGLLDRAVGVHRRCRAGAPRRVHRPSPRLRVVRRRRGGTAPPARARRRSRARPASACGQNADSTASFSRWWREPGASGVSCALPAASRRRPGCMRKGALTAASKSKAMAREHACATKGKGTRKGARCCRSVPQALRRASGTRACGCRSRSCRRSPRTAARRSRSRCRPAWPAS